jgi:hypothetical protein
MKCVFLILLSVAACVPAPARQKSPESYTISLPPEPDFSPFQWLIGNWVGKTAGKGTQGQVILSVDYALGKRFIMLREQISLPATKTAPAVREGLLGLLSATASGKEYDLALYSSNGFVTHYKVSARSGEIDFNPSGGPVSPPGWLFRRVIRHTDPGRCTETVDAAPPGQPFFNYYTAILNQVTPATHPSPGHPKP